MKFINIIILSTIMISTVYDDAEGQLFSRIDLGGKAGLNIASEVGPDADGVVIKNANKVAFSVGGVGSYHVHRMLAVQVELVFSTKGTSYDLSGTYYGKVDSYYIELPLLVKVQMPLEIQVEPYLLVGSGFGILLRAVGEDADGSSGNVTEYTSTLDIGPILGLGGAYLLGARGVMSFEVRYYRGLTTLDAAGEKDVYNRTFSFMLGYQCCATSRRRGAND
jgi:hypothetical protein